MKKWPTILFLLLVAPCLMAQTGPFVISVDTAGIGNLGPSVYQTWVMARQTSNGLPVSMVLVSFDCAKRLVHRDAHVVFSSDSTKSPRNLTATVVADVGPWQPFTDPRIDDLVCAVGRKKYKPESAFRQS